MSYPFANPEMAFGGDIASFSELAYTDSPFDDAFPGRLPQINAYNFDDITKKVCSYRSAKDKKLLHSADAMVILSLEDVADVEFKGVKYCFIEFKNQKVENVQSVKEPTDNALMRKAFDSLSICAMTFSRDCSMADLQKSSAFIVVYPRQNYSDKFLSILNELSLGDGTRKPLWLLDRLQDAGFFRKVLTIDDREFGELVRTLRLAS